MDIYHIYGILTQLFVAKGNIFYLLILNHTNHKYYVSEIFSLFLCDGSIYILRESYKLFNIYTEKYNIKISGFYFIPLQNAKCNDIPWE